MEMEVKRVCHHTGRSWPALGFTLYWVTCPEELPVCPQGESLTLLILLLQPIELKVIWSLLS